MLSSIRLGLARFWSDRFFARRGNAQFITLPGHWRLRQNLSALTLLAHAGLSGDAMDWNAQLRGGSHRSLPPEIDVSLVSALYNDCRSLFVGAIAASGTALTAY